MRRQWPVRQAARRKQPALAVALHDERRRAIMSIQPYPARLGLGIGFLDCREIGHVQADPLAGDRVALCVFAAVGRWVEVDVAFELAAAEFLCQSGLFRPWVAGWIGRGAVVHLAAVGRPGEAPAERDPVVALAVGGLVDPLGMLGARRVDAGVDPGAAGGRSVVLEVGEAREQLLVGPGV